MTTRLLQGDCRVTLPTLPERSVQACITSPPYYSLRDYGTDPVIWGEEATHQHEWLTVVKPAANGIVNGAMQGETLNGTSGTRKPSSSGLCACGAWRGSLGLEPTPDLFIEHLVECFRHVRRVLTDDGVLFLNLGDSYAGSGKGPTGHNGIGDQIRRQGFDKSDANRGSLKYNPLGGVPPAGYKPKDLMMMPARVALALQSDGWYLRSMIPWLKRNSMPESVTDRPATAVEYVFLFSKSRSYYWDADAVRVEQSANTHARGSGHTPKERPMGEGIKANASFHAATNGQWLPNGRNRRNSDWFFESWQGLMLDEQDDPLALLVNPAPFKESHFATFPPKLVEPMIKASTRPGDWLLDPFFGSGTVGLVADRLGRNCYGCELKPDYVDMGEARVNGDAPMFADVEVA